MFSSILIDITRSLSANVAYRCAGLSGSVLYLMVFVAVHPSNESSPRSFPNPLILIPPNGTFSWTIPHELTVTWPLSSARLTRSALDTLFVKMALLRPYSVLFAFSMTSLSVLNLEMACIIVCQLKKSTKTN